MLCRQVDSRPGPFLIPVQAQLKKTCSNENLLQQSLRIFQMKFLRAYFHQGDGGNLRGRYIKKLCNYNRNYLHGCTLQLVLNEKMCEQPGFYYKQDGPFNWSWPWRSKSQNVEREPYCNNTTSLWGIINVPTGSHICFGWSGFKATRSSYVAVTWPWSNCANSGWWWLWLGSYLDLQKKKKWGSVILRERNKVRKRKKTHWAVGCCAASSFCGGGLLSSQLFPAHWWRLENNSSTKRTQLSYANVERSFLIT